VSTRSRHFTDRISWTAALLAEQAGRFEHRQRVGPWGLDMGDWPDNLHGHGREEELGLPIVIGELGLDEFVAGAARGDLRGLAAGATECRRRSKSDEFRRRQSLSAPT